VPDRRDPFITGLTVVCAFGFGWALVGVAGLPGPAAVKLLLDVVAAASAVLVHTVGRRWRTASLTAGTNRVRRPRGAVGRNFMLVNVGQVVLILAAVFGSAATGHPKLIAPLVCLVVGLHFLPLGRIFDLRPYLVTGALLVLVAVAGLLTRQLAVVGFPAAAVLWGTGLYIARSG
jgi:hypothetical protein